MVARLRLTRALRHGALIFAVWTVYGVVWADLLYVWRPMTGAPFTPFFGMLRYCLPDAWLWALLTPPMIAAAHRYPISLAAAARRVPLHAGLALVIHLVHGTVIWAVHPYTRLGPRPRMPASLYGELLYDLALYAVVIALVQIRDAERQALRLRTQLAEAELRVLRMQLQPHFLFNTLHAVTELVHVDPRAAERALVRLADLLRWSLGASARAQVPLREELAALETYLEIQRLRHGDGLRFTVAADPATLELGVPSLVLQPLVENAIRHGIAGAERGAIAITARQVDGQLVLTVDDDGRGLSDPRPGVGLETTRARLAGLYGSAARLALESRAPRGTRARVEVPALPVSQESGA